MKLTGLIPATVTPFNLEGQIDDNDLYKHIKQVSEVEGVTGVAVNGHAGEILALNSEERAHIVKVAKKALPRNKKLIAGIDGRSIPELVEEGRKAARNGADGLLVLPPFDVRPYRILAQHGPTVHKLFQALSDEVGLPIVIFLYPEKDGCTYPDSVLESLMDIKNVIAIKAGAGNVTRYSGIWASLHDKISVLAANDSPELLGMLLTGAHGSLIGISVVGTEKWSQVVNLSLDGKAEKARGIFNKFCLPLAKVIFENQNPVSNISPFAATKEALYQMGQISTPVVRFPLISPDQNRKEEIAKVLSDLGLVKLEESMKGRT